MGFLMAAIGAVTGIVKGVKAIKKVFGGRKAKPVVKIAQATAAGLGIGAGAKMIGGSGIMPVSGGGGLPALAMGQTRAIQQAGPGGLPVPLWKGPGGRLQLPGSDPRIPEYLKQFALDDAYLKPYYRAPRGYVVVRDASGRPFAVNKTIARQFGIWKPKKKPPISVSDWQAFKKAQRVEKKLRKVAGPALRKYSRRSSTTTSTRRK